MRYSRRVVLAAATIAAGLPLTVAAGATGGAAGPGTPVSSTVSESAAAGAIAYWTPARMAAARPVDVVVSKMADDRIPAAELGGVPIVVPPAAPVGATDGPGSLASTEGLAIRVPKPYTNLPDRVNGKVFFTRPGLGDFVCSGTAVNSPNKSVVWTAGHCVEGGTSGGFHTQWVFVPAYGSSTNGSSPYSIWSGRQLSSLVGWTSSGDVRYDLGAAVVSPVAGVRLVNRVGGDGIKFNIAPGSRSFSAFGYPTGAPFNGGIQWRCNDVVTRDTVLPNPDRPLKMFCNMTGGASGGAWKIDFLPTGLAFVNSVTSYKYADNVNFLYGPFQGGAAANLYNAVRNAPVI